MCCKQCPAPSSLSITIYQIVFQSVSSAINEELNVHVTGKNIFDQEYLLTCGIYEIKSKVF